MTELKAGDRVRRVKGAIYQIGDEGAVVEINAEAGRVRVAWEGKGTASGATTPRTWVKFACVEVVQNKPELVALGDVRFCQRFRSVNGGEIFKRYTGRQIESMTTGERFVADPAAMVEIVQD